MKSTKSIIIVSGVSLVLAFPMAAHAAAAGAVPPPPPVQATAEPSIPDLMNQSQTNISMAQMMFKVGQLQGQLAQKITEIDHLKAGKPQAADTAGLSQQLKAAEARIADLSKPRCDGPQYLPHSSPNPYLAPKK
jgi:hypothetical protein